MMSRALIHQEANTQGFLYRATDEAEAFLAGMQSPYMTQFRQRAEWVASTFDQLDVDDLEAIVNRLFEAWTTEFQPVQLGTQAELQL